MRPRDAEREPARADRVRPSGQGRIVEVMDSEQGAAPSTPQVTRDDVGARYVLTVEGREAGHIAFRRDGGRMVLTHTTIDPAFNGQGLGSTLVRGALADVRAAGLRLVPQCLFVAGYLRKHPEVADLVDGA